MTGPVEPQAADGSEPEAGAETAASDVSGAGEAAGDYTFGPDVAWDDEAGPLVRPYTLTRGRTVAARDRDLTLITLVTAVPRQPGAVGPHGARPLQPEHTRILGLCSEPQAVAELAALVDLPVSIVKVLVNDLLDRGLVGIRPPLALARDAGAGTGTHGPNIDLLRRVRDGLARI